MVLLQGDSIQSWLGCAEAFKYTIDPDWIGVPRCMEGIDGAHRLDFVQWANMIFPNKPIHLFGFSDSIWYDILAARHSAVYSMDSAVPLRINPDMVLSWDAGSRGDWWEKAKYTPDMIRACKMIDQYIRGF